MLLLLPVRPAAPSESAAHSALRCLLRHVAPAAPPEHAAYTRPFKGPQSVMPSRVVPSSSAVARTWLAVPPSRSAAGEPRWRSCRAAPPRLRPMARSPGWVCSRRCRESLHPSSSAVVRLRGLWPANRAASCSAAPPRLSHVARGLPVDGSLRPAVPRECAVGVVSAGSMT